MTPYAAFYAEDFEEALFKLDRNKRLLLLKRIEKILETPTLGKPLHAPLHGFRAERFENMRIVYSVNEATRTVTLVLLDYRKSVYR